MERCVFRQRGNLLSEQSAGTVRENTPTVVHKFEFLAVDRLVASLSLPISRLFSPRGCLAADFPRLRGLSRASCQIPLTHN